MTPHTKAYAGAKPHFKSPLRRHFVVLPLLLLACAAFFAWAAYSFLPAAAGATRRQIVNDDYSTLTPTLAAGDELLQDIVINGRIYGLILNVSTLGRAPRGTLHLRLHAEDGGLVAACDTDMSLLLDNTFHRFLFNAPVNGGGGARYQLSVTLSPASAQDALAFHKSSGPAQDLAQHVPGEPLYSLAEFHLRENGGAVEGTLALQYVTRYAGASPARLFALLAALLCVLVLLGYGLLFVFRFSLPFVAAAACLLLGVGFILLLPAHAVPQKEPLADVYHYSSVLLGQGGQDSTAGLLSSKAGTPANGALFVREQDAFLFQPRPLDVFAWQDQLEGFPTGGNKAVVAPAARAGIPPVFTAPAVLVFALCRLFGLSGLAMLVLAQMVNLLLYAAIAFLALRRMPLAKPLLAAIFLLPASLQAAVSFTGGGLALALFLLLCAQALRQWEKKPRWCANKLLPLAGLVFCLAGLCFAALRAGLPLQNPPPTGVPTALTAAIATTASPSFSSLVDSFFSALVGGGVGSATAGAGPGWLLLLALAGLVWALSLPALGAQRPFAPKTRLAAGLFAGFTAVGFTLLATLVPTAHVAGASAALPDAILLLPVFFLLLVALRGRNLAFARDACRPLLFAFLLALALFQANVFITIAV